MGRVYFPPLGWFDERAKRNGEFSAFAYVNFEPRAMTGMRVLQYHYHDPDKLDSLMIYVPSLRRMRKMSASDTQDPQGDLTYDDSDMMSQKITAKKYPYKFEIIEEREYLIPLAYASVPQWVESKNFYALRGTRFQRRPIYVLEMTNWIPTMFTASGLFTSTRRISHAFWQHITTKGARSTGHRFIQVPPFTRNAGWLSPMANLFCSLITLTCILRFK